MQRTPARVALGAMVLLLAACAGGTALGPDNQLQVSNNPDSFEWQASNLSSVTQRLTYTWLNTGTVATVNQASSIAGGVVTVIVKDASGIQVYLGDQKNNGTFDTVLGTSGSWTIDVVLSDASGAVNFRVDKKP